MRNYYKKLKKGFTLVELVVVIAVIAILAAVSVGAYFGITDSANSSNATTSLKQVKDYWTMYSVSDYDASKTDYETGNDFAARYITYQGYDVAVNFKTVNYTRNTGAQGLAGYDNGNGILFKVETNYPTWILVEDNRIIAESKAPLKNNEEFMASLEEGEYVITTLANWNDFELTTLKSGDTDVRGVGYVKYVVTSNEDNVVTTKTYYVNAKNALADEYTSFVPGGYTGLVANNQMQIQSEEVWKIYEVNGSERKEFDTTVPLENVSNEIIEAIPSSEQIVNGHIVAEIILDQEYANLSLKQFNINDYPVILKIGSSYIAYKSLDDLNGKYIDQNGEEQPKLPAATHTKDNYKTYNYIFCYGSEAKLNTSLVIPTGYIMAVEFTEFTGIATMSNFVDNYISKINNTTKVVNTDEYIPSNSKYKLFETDSVIYYDSTESIPAGVESDEIFGLNTKIAIEKNKVTINGTLEFSNDSHLFNEAIFSIPGGTYNGSGVLDHAAIHMGQTGKIKLSINSVLRSLGKMYGGTIETTGDNTNGSIIYDLFKPYAFLGGTLTSLHIGSGVFPIYNYIFDNINSNVIINTGAKYKLITGLEVSDGKTFMAPIDLIGSNNVGFLMLGNNSKLEINYNNGKININLLNGTFSLGEINLSLYGKNIRSKDYRFPLNNINLTVGSASTLSVDKYEYLAMPNSKIINYGKVYATNGAKISVLNFDASGLETFTNSLKFKNQNIGTHKVGGKYINWDCTKTKVYNGVLYETFRYFARYLDNKILYNYGYASIDSTSGLYTLQKINNIQGSTLVNSSTAAAEAYYGYLHRITHSDTLCSLFNTVSGFIDFNSNTGLVSNLGISRHTESYSESN